MSEIYNIDEIYGAGNVASFEAELERVEQALAPDPKAVDKAKRFTEQWDLHSFEQRLLAVELDFFEVRPQCYDAAGATYAYNYEQAGDRLVCQGVKWSMGECWQLRLGATEDKLEAAIYPGYFNTAKEVFDAVAANIHGLIFNVEHEAVLATFGFCARQALYTRQED